MKQSPSHTPAPQQTPLLKRLTALNVLIPHQEEILRYLDEYAPLGKPLVRICAKLVQEFGTDVELSLELYKDPEIDNRYLSLYVRLEKYDTDILQRIDTATKPFDKQLEKAPGYLLVTTDFRRPRGKDAIRLESLD